MMDVVNENCGRYDSNSKINNSNNYLNLFKTYLSP